MVGQLHIYVCLQEGNIWVLVAKMGRIVNDVWLMIIRGLYYPIDSIDHEEYHDGTSSTAQGGGGSFKNRKPIGEVGCCESGMAERSH